MRLGQETAYLLFWSQDTDLFESIEFYSDDGLEMAVHL